MTDPFLDDVAEWLLSAGWALFFASSTYAAVRLDAGENGPTYRQNG
jgi:endonuclease YncB( thermonuclease family)